MLKTDPANLYYHQLLFITNTDMSKENDIDLSEMQKSIQAIHER